jgi:hypothetical protein
MPMFILELILFIVSILAGAYSLRSWWMSSDRPAEFTADGSMILRYSRNMLWLGFISLLIGAGLVVITFLFENIIETGITLFIMGIVFVIAGVWFIFGFYHNRLIVNQRYIRQRKWLGRDTIIDWARLEIVRFSSKSGNFILRGIKGEKIKVSRLMRGFNNFKAILEQQVPDANFDHESMKEYRKLIEMEKELLDELKLDHQPKS